MTSGLVARAEILGTYFAWHFLKHIFIYTSMTLIRDRIAISTNYLYISPGEVEYVRSNKIRIVFL